MTLNPKFSKLLKYAGIAAVVAIVAWIVYRFWNGYKKVVENNNGNTENTTTNSASNTPSASINNTSSTKNSSITPNTILVDNSNDKTIKTFDCSSSLDIVRSSAASVTPSTTISIGNNSNSIVSLQPADLNTKLEVSDINLGLTI